MDVARSAPQGAHYHANVIYLNKEGNKVLMVLRVKPTPTRCSDKLSLNPDGQQILMPPRCLAGVKVFLQID